MQRAMVRAGRPDQARKSAWRGLAICMCVCVLGGLGGLLWFGGATGVVAQGKSQEQCQASGSQPSLGGMAWERDACQLFFGIFVAFFFFAAHIFSFALSLFTIFVKKQKK